MALATTDGLRGPDAESTLERHRIELTSHCARMLGSRFDADDAVQATMVRAWRGLPAFEQRSSLRSWLYRIATNVCYDALRGHRRHTVPVDFGPAATERASADGENSATSRIPWALDDAYGTSGADPAETVATRESLRHALTASMRLAPRQRAVLILRDALRLPATEVASMLGTTATSVHSALQRARANVAGADPGAPNSLTAREHALLSHYVDAFERCDVRTLAALARQDAPATTRGR